MNKIKTFNKKFIDEYGRERIFYGMNINDKAPWSITKTEHDFDGDLSWIDRFYESGFNIIRLGTTWSALEPEPGKYNEKLIASLKKIMNLCEEKGIYVFLDMHQDLYSSYMGSGDGAPSWATMSDGIKAWKQRYVWAENYFWGRACHRAFDHFWNNDKVNGKGLQDYFTDMWAYLVASVKDCKNLIGYDILNEPFPGTKGGTTFRRLIANVAVTTVTDSRIDKKKLVTDALSGDIVEIINQYDGDVLLKIASAGKKLIGGFDSKYYTPFLNKTTAGIRKVTNEGIVFIEGNYYSNIGIPSGTFPITADGKREEKQCYSPHGYDFMVDTELYKYASNSRVDAIFEQHRKTQSRMNVPVLVGEWGGDSSGTEWFDHIEYLLNIFDKNKWSSTYWTFNHDTMDRQVINVLVRPFPKAVTGNINSYCYDSKNDVFTLEYTQGREYGAPTEIFAHKEIERIETDGEYTFNPHSEKSGDVIIKTGVGKHTVKIYFKESSND